MLGLQPCLHLNSSVPPQHQNPCENISIAPSPASDSDVCPVDLKTCNVIKYEKKGNCVHGVSYNDEGGVTGWTLVVGRKKRLPQNLPQAFLRRLPPDAHKCYVNDSDSDSDRDLNDMIPDQ